MSPSPDTNVTNDINSGKFIWRTLPGPQRKLRGSESESMSGTESGSESGSGAGRRLDGTSISPITGGVTGNNVPKSGLNLTSLCLWQIGNR